MERLVQSQQQILKHHGGDGDHARAMITGSYERRHDDAFWDFWQKWVALNYQAGDGILDMGAGIGQFLLDCANRYPDAKVFGIEAAPYMLAHQLTLPNNAQLLVADLNSPLSAETKPIADNSLAMVMINMVVHELTQPIKMFQAAYRWLKPGGRMCIIDVVRQPLENYLQHRYSGTELWDNETTLADLEEAFEHFLEHNRYHPQDIEYMLTSGGLELVYKETYRDDRFVRMVVEKPIGR